MKRYFLPLLLGAMLILSGCGTQNNSSSEQSSSMKESGVAESSQAEAKVKEEKAYTVTDIAGREITFDRVPEKVIAIGHGTLKFYTYIAGSDKLEIGRAHV